MKKVLLIAFKFPPYAGVGGFRWSKLSKHLASMGHQIHVVTVNWNQMGPNTFMSDIQHENIKIHRIPSWYPHNLKYNKKKNIFEKILFKIFQLTIGELLYYDDEAQIWGISLIPFCEKLIKNEGISVVIATGHPFQDNRWAAALKKRMPDLKLIHDFRDPWADNPDIKHSSRIQAKIRKWQKNAVEIADSIVSVTPSLLDLYLRNTTQKNGVVIRNGVDLDVSAEKRKRIKNKVISMIYAGNLNCGRDDVLDVFLQSFAEIVPDKILLKLTVVGGVSEKILKKFSDLILGGYLEFLETMTQEKVFDYIRKSDFAIQLSSKEQYFAATTKIYEYAMLRTPVISLNYGGDADELVRKYDFGYSINVEKDDIKEFLLALSSNKKNFKFKTETFTYKHIAKEYSKLIQSI